MARDGSLTASIATWLPTTHGIALLRDSIVWRDMAVGGYHLAWSGGLLVGAIFIAVVVLRSGLQE